MEFDLRNLPDGNVSKLMHAVVVPRPIAFITTQSSRARNAAPYSFFNVVSANPAVVAIGIGESGRAGDRVKDTARNIHENGDFVVNMVTESMLPGITLAAVDVVADVDEIELGGFTMTPARHVSAPMVAESPVSLECTKLESAQIAPGREVIIGSVLAIHIKDGYVIDRDKCYVDGGSLGLLGRMHGGGWYARTTDLIHKERLSIEDIP